ncbi:hypothetical protein B5F79_10555 [Olsenella sp. An285]|uniref:S-layer homology domain-containing protein n=1 Tax=Olsenella sp. An285 TaxID=1965621 RepID=UPI000B391F63|nr:S-layer homology domain-containing protein [Olsenella sp. An285]OUO45006.1 hypothetical protein B5F79_10555 [Olsenella sp. An285]
MSRRAGSPLSFLALAALLLAAPVTARAGYLGFEDVSVVDWAARQGYVEYVTSEGLMTGLTETSFGPGEPVSRAQVATILWRVAGEPAPSADAPRFPDCDYSDASFYADAVSWARETEVVTGYQDGRFGPADPVTREQLATMLMRYARNVAREDVSADDSALSGMVDAGSVSGFAREGMAWAVSEGIVSGDLSAGAPRAFPQSPAQRDQTAKMVSVFHAEVLGMGRLPEPVRLGRYGSFLAKVRELEGGHGTAQLVSGVRDWGFAVEPANWLVGTCFAGVIDFGDGEERLVTAFSRPGVAQRYPDAWDDYHVQVWEYDEAADATRLSWEGGSTLLSVGYPRVELSVSPDGSRTYIHVNRQGDESLFVGVAADGSFGVVRSASAYYTGSGTSASQWHYIVDGREVSNAGYWAALREMGLPTNTTDGNLAMYEFTSDADVAVGLPEVTLAKTRETIAWLEDVA